MPHVITGACQTCKDGGCVDVCPSDCIHPTRDEPGHAEAEMLYIDPDNCIDCGMCVTECPTNAIYSEDDLPADMQEFIEKNAAYYQ